MEPNKLHLVSDCINDTSDWIEDFADEGVGEIEEFLAKHAAFGAFLADRSDPVD